MAFVVKVDGTREDLEEVNLDTLQAAVGGLIQIVNTPGGQEMVIDEEGKLKNKPVNDLATQLYNNNAINDLIESGFDVEVMSAVLSCWDDVVGDVVILEKGELN